MRWKESGRPERVCEETTEESNARRVTRPQWTPRVVSPGVPRQGPLPGSLFTSVPGVAHICLDETVEASSRTLHYPTLDICVA